MSFIHPSSIIEDGAIIGQNVSIGPFCYIASCVTVGNGCTLVSHVSLGGKPQSSEPPNPLGRVVIGANTTMNEFVTVHRPCKQFTKVGNDCLLMSAAHVAHDCIVGNHVTITSISGISGYCEIGDYTVISGGCHVHQYSKIGRYCMLGAGTYIKGDSPDGIVWIGDKKPAKPLKVNEIGLQRNMPSDIEEIRIAAERFINATDN